MAISCHVIHMRTTLIAVLYVIYCSYMCIYAQGSDCRCYIEDYLRFKNFSIDWRRLHQQSKMHIYVNKYLTGN